MNSMQNNGIRGHIAVAFNNTLCMHCTDGAEGGYVFFVFIRSMHYALFIQALQLLREPGRLGSAGLN